MGVFGLIRIKDAQEHIEPRRSNRRYKDVHQNKIAMKKLILALFVLLISAGVASARDTYAHDASVLPKAAKAVVDKNFKSKVSVVKIDKDLGRVSEYEVVMTDGAEVTFDSKGNWKEVEVGVGASVPTGFVPKAIETYVTANHKGQHIVGIQKDRKKYEVELSNGIEMRFDLNGRFLRYDD